MQISQEDLYDLDNDLFYVEDAVDQLGQRLKSLRKDFDAEQYGRVGSSISQLYQLTTDLDGTIAQFESAFKDITGG